MARGPWWSPSWIVDKWIPSESIDNASGQSWAYPNRDSYRSMDRNGITHGYIFRVHQTDGLNTNPSSIAYNAGKKFQINPPAVSLRIGMEDVDHPDTETPGSNIPGVAFGAATMAFTMIFDRSQETARATNGNSTPTNSIFKDIGVQKDVFDVFEVMTGRSAESHRDALLDPEPNDIFSEGAVEGKPRSMRDISQHLFDISAVGLDVRLTPLALVFNTNMAFFGYPTSLNVEFLKFNHNLVPVLAHLSMSLQIISGNSVQGIRDTVGEAELADSEEGESTGSQPWPLSWLPSWPPSWWPTDDAGQPLSPQSPDWPIEEGESTSSLPWPLNVLPGGFPTDWITGSPPNTS